MIRSSRYAKAAALRLVATVALASLAPQPVAARECSAWVAKVVSMQGRVEVFNDAAKGWMRVMPDAAFCPGDTVRVRDNSRAALVLYNDTIMQLDENTAVSFSDPAIAVSSWLDLLHGAAYFISRVRQSFEVKTPFVNAAVEGTEFMIRIGPDGTEVTVFEGSVTARSRFGELVLAHGQSALAAPGKAPVLRSILKPRDAVSWALYYPPILDIDAAAFADLPAATQRALERALEAQRGGDVAAALAELESLREGARATSVAAYRASLRLRVGRVDLAEADLDQALESNPRYGPAIALQAIIAVTQNDKARALSLAQRAVEAAPDSAAAWLALSYARQAAFDIEGALAATRQAVERNDADALAWARLSELYLAVGRLDRALEAAREATARDPGLARTHTVLGFARLTQFQTVQARESFERAIELDPADPLPRLGLGLAMIRQGQAGRRDIEIAATLDPNNAIIRSYLGKAYFDEKRDELAATELAVAKELDPKDPTPWFYDGIRKQTENRPVQALRDVQQSVALNDNRAVYRSSLLLDQDLAARSASLGRIYQDLGFRQLALAEGWKSVNADPSNYSAHRFLADTYSALPRHEIARVSELLQSQLLQPINLTPLQAELAETNLAIIEGAGPSEQSFSEFNPLFARNQFDLQASGIVGSGDTFGDNLILTGLHNRLSLSAAQFHYQSDGFRQNYDLDHDIYNAFTQYAISANASVQLELRHRETEHGDLNQRFDPTDLFPDFFLDRRNAETDQARIGFRYSPTPRSDFLVSLVYRGLEEDILSVRPAGADLIVTERSANTDGYTGELQYLFRGTRMDAVIGGGSLRQDGNGMRAITFTVDGMSFPEPPFAIDLDTQHDNAYLYTTWSLLPRTALTLGASYDDFEDLATHRTQLNPKLGLIWDVTDTTTLRAAAFKTLKRSLLSNQTIEPTQVAGFNQFFDDLDGTDAWRYGIGVDHRFSGDLYGGAELSARDAEEAFVEGPGVIEGSQEFDEQLHRGYLYWTPLPALAASAEYQFDAFERAAPASSEQPLDVETHTASLGLGYYAGRFSLRLGANYVHQQVEFAEFTGPTEFDVVDGSESFWTADASIGYRLPKRWGSVSILANNLFDEEFRFQDRNFQADEPFAPRFIPERTVFLRFTLAF